MNVDAKLLLEMIEQELQNAEQPRKELHDHEGRMARSELRDMIKNGLILYKTIGKDDELPGWVSSYITLASDYMHSVMEYMVEDEQSDEQEELPDDDMSQEPVDS